MACFDHSSILISQLVLRTHEDHDTVNAEEPVPLLSSRTLAYKTNHQSVQFGSAEPFLPELCCIC
jgi:hypothetical protein